MRSPRSSTAISRSFVSERIVLPQHGHGLLPVDLKALLDRADIPAKQFVQCAQVLGRPRLSLGGEERQQQGKPARYAQRKLREVRGKISRGQRQEDDGKEGGLHAAPGKRSRPAFHGYQGGPSAVLAAFPGQSGERAAAFADTQLVEGITWGFEGTEDDRFLLATGAVASVQRGQQPFVDLFPDNRPAPPKEVPENSEDGIKKRNSKYHV